MPVVRSNFPVNLLTPAVAPPTETRVGASTSLRLEQLVQAFVVDVDNDRTVIEIGSQRFQVVGKSDLQVGEELTLQVQKVEPQLEFGVLNSPVHSRLAQALPSLAQPFDWGKLVTRLQSLAAEGRLPQAAVTVLNQLEDLLVSPLPQPEMRDQFEQVVSQLRQYIDQSSELFIGAPRVSSVLQNPQFAAETELHQAIVSLVKSLQVQ